jgi:uncharacterized membrane protein YphA (DoxX/SURF4 family)
MKTAFLMGRIIVGAFFLYNAVDHFVNRAMLAGFAASKGVPYPEIAVLASGMLLLIAGVSFLFGWKPVVGIAAVTLFLIPVSITMHPFWKEAGEVRMADMANFAKNIALLGAAWMFAAIPRPWTAGVESSARTTEIAPVDYPARRTAAG